MLIRETIFGVTDVETTGVDKEIDRVVECAIVSAPMLRETFAVGHSKQSVFSPGKSIPPEASAVHHITDEDVEGLRPFQDVGEEWFSHQAFAAHFAEFEAGFIPQIGSRPLVCTYRLARHLWPNLDQYGNQYLRYLHKLKIPKEVAALSMHRAYPDAVVTAHLLDFEIRVLADLHPEIETIEQLVDWISNPFLLYRITFGKYGPHGQCNPGPKGWLWSDVPRDYLEWLAEQWAKDQRKGIEVQADADTVYTVNYYLGE